MEIAWYSLPSVSLSSASMNSTKHRSKIFGKNNSRKFQKLNLPRASNYLRSIYIILLDIISNLVITESIQEELSGLCANTMPFYIRDLREHP